MKLALTLLAISLFSTATFAECQNQDKSLESLSLSMSTASCEVEFYSVQALHNAAIDSHTDVAKLVDRSKSSFSKTEQCSLLKEAQKLVPQTIKAYEKCWKVSKKGIIACVHTDNIDTVVEAADSCLKGLETAQEWSEIIKGAVKSTCK